MHRKCRLGSSCTYPAAQSIWGIHTWLSNVIKYSPVGPIISLTPNHLLKDIFLTCLWAGEPMRRKEQAGWAGTPGINRWQGLFLPQDKVAWKEQYKSSKEKSAPFSLTFSVVCFLAVFGAEPRASHTRANKCSTSEVRLGRGELVEVLSLVLQNWWF